MGTEPDGTPPAIVEQLTEAHKEFLLSLPQDGSWRETTSRDFDRHGPNAFKGFGRSGLIRGEYSNVMRHRLTPLGIQVRAALAERKLVPTPAA